MFGNCILAADLTKTYYFATVPEIADRLCVSNVCIPVYLCACVGPESRAAAYKGTVCVTEHQSAGALSTLRQCVRACAVRQDFDGSKIKT